MAATDQYAHANIAAGKLVPAIAGGDGVKLRILTATYAKVAGDGDGSTLRLWKGVDTSLIPIYGGIGNAAIAGLTSVKLGFYRTGLGGAIVGTGDQLMAATNIAAGKASLNPVTAWDACAAISLANAGQKPIWDLCGLTKEVRELDIVLTMTTAGANTGQITAFLVCAQG